MAEQNIDKLSYKQLKERCVMEGMLARGTKKQLIIALRAHLNSKSSINNYNMMNTNYNNNNFQIETRNRASTEKSHKSQYKNQWQKPYKPKPKISPLPKWQPIGQIPRHEKQRSRSITNRVSFKESVVEHLALMDNDSDDDILDSSSNYHAKSVPPPNMQQIQQLHDMFPPPPPLPKRAFPKMGNKAVSAPVEIIGNGIRTKRLYWTPIDSECIDGSIWENLNEEWIDYDRKHFELHFQVRQRKPVNEQKSARPIRHNEHDHDKRGKIVSKKRANHILIGLQELNININDLRKILLNMDENIMNGDKLSKLLQIIPSLDEQIQTETNLRGNSDDKVEQFLYSLYDFYHLEQRLKLWLFKINFVEIIDSVESQYKIIAKTCEKIKNNHNLRLLLAIILEFGNAMNTGSTLEETKGFDLKILTKLTSILSFDNTRSLLMYIYDFCDKKYPNAIQILPELTNILKSAISIEMEMLNGAYQKMMDNMDEIKQLIGSDEIENYDINDRFIMVLTQFYQSAAKKLKSLSIMVKRHKLSIQTTMILFCFGTKDNPKTITSFFQIWWKFIEDFSASKEKLIEIEKERLQRMEKRKKQKDIEKRNTLHQRYGIKQEDIMPILHKQSTIDEELQKRTNFDRYKLNLHGKLRNNVKRRSKFIASGGKLLSDDEENKTMKALSSMYRDQVKNKYKSQLLQQSTMCTPPKMSLSSSSPNPAKNGYHYNYKKQQQQQQPMYPPLNDEIQRLKQQNEELRSRLRKKGRPKSPLSLKQSASNIFAQNDEMEDWELKYYELQRKYDALNENNTQILTQKMNEIQRYEARNKQLEQTVLRLQELNEDLVKKQENEEKKEDGMYGFKDKIIFLDKEMNSFGNMYNKNTLLMMYENDTRSLMVKNELNGLQSTNESFGKILYDISSYIKSIGIPNVINYDEWDINDMILWIKSLDNGRFIQYCDSLKNGFMTDGISNGGALLILDDQNDLRDEPFNIISMPDRKALIKHFQSLPTLKSQIINAIH